MGCREGIDPADFATGVDPDDTGLDPRISVRDAKAYRPVRDDPDAIWVEFPVYVTNIDLAAEVTAHYATSNDTATAGTHYVAQSGTVVLPAGTTDVLLRIPVLPGSPTKFTGSKTFHLTLSAPSGAVLGDAVGAGLIDYDDLDNPTVPPPSPPVPRLTMIWPYWQGADTAKVEAVSDDMVYMHMDGVILMGMDWSPPGEYALPADVSDYLDIFIRKGIRPYLGLWTAQMSPTEQATAIDAIDAGEGKWAGIVTDAEDQWVTYVAAESDPDKPVAKARFDSFMGALRERTSTLIYITYASPTSFPNYKYSWWNEVCDYAMPAAFFDDPNDTAAHILSEMYRKFAQAATSQSWTQPPKPFIPLTNGYNSDLTAAQAVQRRLFLLSALARDGAAGFWRWIGSFPDNMRQELHNLSPTTGGDNPDAYTGWTDIDRVTYDEFNTQNCAYDTACTGYAGAAAMSALYSRTGVRKGRFNAKKLYTDAGGSLCTNCQHAACADGWSPGKVVDYMYSTGVQLIDDSPNNEGKGANYSCKYRDNTADHAMFKIEKPIPLGGTGVAQADLIAQLKSAIRETGVVYMSSIFYPDWNQCRGVDNYILRPHNVGSTEEVGAAAEEVIAQAWAYVRADSPYQLGGEGDVGSGVDCSGLIYRIFTDTGNGALIGNARKLAAGYTKQANDAGRFTTDQSQVRRGDMVVYKHRGGGGRVVHIALYIGNGYCISALKNPLGVSKHVINLTSVDYYGILRVPYPPAPSLVSPDSTAEADSDPEEQVDFEQDDPDDTFAPQQIITQTNLRADTSSLTHAWILVGWDDSYLVPNEAIWGDLAGQRVGCFRIQSSHGCDWGFDGRGYIPYSYLIPTWQDAPAVRFKYWRLEWAGPA